MDERQGRFNDHGDRRDRGDYGNRGEFRGERKGSRDRQGARDEHGYASATIDREQDNTTTIGDLASIDRATIDADAMMMTVAIDVEVDEVLEADTTIVQT